MAFAGKTTKKTSRKQSKTKKNKTLDTDSMALWLPLGPTLSVEFWFFLACLFSRGLFWFLTKNWKTSRKPKNKKIDAIWPNGYTLAPHSLWSFVFFGLCVFSGSCGLFRCLTKKWQKPRENKQQKNKALDRMALWLPLGPTSSVELFVSRCFFVWFLAEIVAKTSRKQKTQNSRRYGPMATLGPT